MAYAPPHMLKPRLDVVGTTSTKSKLNKVPLAVLNIQKHYWPTPIKAFRQFSTASDPGTASDAESGYGPDTDSVDERASRDGAKIDGAIEKKDRTPEDTEEYWLSTKEAHTLNATEAEPHKLAYLVLWHDQNPRWVHEGIIFARSNLGLLPAQSKNETFNGQVSQATDDVGPPAADKIEAQASKIPVFHQIRGSQSQGKTSKFRFLGYYTLTYMQILEPSSAEVKRMLEQKCGMTEAGLDELDLWKASDYWRRSVIEKWAVLKFARDDKATKELEPPLIEADQGPKVKSVNELLKEVRLKHGNS